jgi:hypothetical protein
MVTATLCAAVSPLLGVHLVTPTWWCAEGSCAYAATCSHVQLCYHAGHVRLWLSGLVCVSVWLVMVLCFLCVGVGVFLC